MLEENRRFWAVGGAVLVVVVIVLGGYLLFRGGAESKVTVRSIPNDLTLTLDGRATTAGVGTERRAPVDDARLARLQRQFPL